MPLLPSLLLSAALHPGALLSVCFMLIGAAVLALSTLGFTVSVLAFLSPYGLALRRSASSTTGSLWGYVGASRFTLRQRSSAAP